MMNNNFCNFNFQWWLKKTMLALSCAGHFQKEANNSRLPLTAWLHIKKRIIIALPLLFPSTLVQKLLQSPIKLL